MASVEEGRHAAASEMIPGKALDERKDRDGLVRRDSAPRGGIGEPGFEGVRHRSSSGIGCLVTPASPAFTETANSRQLRPCE